MDADSARTFVIVKVNRDGVCDLLLQIAKIRPLRGDASGSSRVIPPCDEHARFFVALNLKGNLFHYWYQYSTPMNESRVRTNRTALRAVRWLGA